MKATVRRNRTLVSKMGRGVPAVWVDNSEFWPRALARTLTDVKYSEANAVSMEMPGNIIAIGRRGLSFVAEIAPTHRVIEVHDHEKRYIEDEERGGESIRQIYVPKMLIAAAFSAAQTLSTCYAFHINSPDDLEFSSDAYLDQPLFLTGFQNFWENGKMCNPSTNCTAPYPTLASMLNTAIEAIFGSTFNTDMGSAHGFGVRDPALTATCSVAEMYQKWEAMTPDQVIAMKWNKSYDFDSVRDIISAMGIGANIRRVSSSLSPAGRLSYASVPNSMGAVARSLAVKDK